MVNALRVVLMRGVFILPIFVESLFLPLEITAEICYN